MIIVRYADDSVVGFERLDDAERFLAAMRERMERFGLSVHSQKTRLIEFGRHAAVDAPSAGLASRRRSTSWDSRTSAAALGVARSRSSA